MNALIELEQEYIRFSEDPAFKEEIAYLLKQYSGRETPLYYAERLSKHLGKAKIYLKREDLNHTGAHKINNAIAQGVLASVWAKARSLPKRAPGAWGCHCNRSRSARSRMQGVHGRRGYQAAAVECIPHENARSRSDSGDLGKPNAEGCRQRGASLLGQQR